MWHLSVVTPATFEPVSLVKMREHCRVDDTYDDTYLTGLISVARAAIENDTGMTLATTTWKQFEDNWPECDHIVLQRTPVASVTHVKWKNTSGTQTTLTLTTDYLVELGTGDPPWAGRIVLPYQVNWPTSALYPSDPIEIQFVAGFATGAAPTPLVQAILLMGYHLFENRAEVEISDNSTFAAEIPRTVKRLIAPYRMRLVG